MTAAANDREPRLKILMSTFTGNERYVDLCVQILAQFWPDHPELIVCSDAGKFRYANKVLVRERAWTAVLAGAMRELAAAGRLAPEDQVILLLEDHIPHAPVDAALVRQLAAYLRENGNSYLNLGGYGQAERTGQVGDCAVHVMRLHTFSSLHPALWSVGHLLRTLQHAQANAIHDPWAFERIALPAVRHFTTGRQVWPSSHGGFLWRGWVNVPSLRHMRKGAQRRLRRMLLRKLALELPARLYHRLRGHAS